MLIVTDVLPAFSPSVWPFPMWIGTCPRRFGSWNVVWPLPPYVVPKSANSAWFWLIGRVWPLQSAHPLGAKLKLTNLISDMNGSDMSPPYLSRCLSSLSYGSEQLLNPDVAEMSTVPPPSGLSEVTYASTPGDDVAAIPLTPTTFTGALVPCFRRPMPNVPLPALVLPVMFRQTLVLPMVPPDSTRIP